MRMRATTPGRGPPSTPSVSSRGESPVPRDGVIRPEIESAVAAELILVLRSLLVPEATPLSPDEASLEEQLHGLELSLLVRLTRRRSVRLYGLRRDRSDIKPAVALTLRPEFIALLRGMAERYPGATSFHFQ